jgi:hypothetical protein
MDSIDARRQKIERIRAVCPRDQREQPNAVRAGNFRCARISITPLQPDSFWALRMVEPPIAGYARHAATRNTSRTHRPSCGLESSNRHYRYRALEPTPLTRMSIRRPASAASMAVRLPGALVMTAPFALEATALLI